jgi:hypothetical protein
MLRAAALQMLAHTLEDQGKSSEAVAAAQRSVKQARGIFARLKAVPVVAQLVKSLDSLAEQHPDAGGVSKGHADTLVNLFQVLIQEDKLEEAELLQTRMAQAVEKLSPSDPETLPTSVRAQLASVELLRRQTKPEAAAKRIEEVMLAAARLDKSGTFASKAWRLELECFVLRAEILASLRRKAEAKAAWMGTSAAAERVLRDPETAAAPRLEAAVALAKAAAYLAENDTDAAQVELAASNAVQAFQTTTKSGGAGLRRELKRAWRDPSVQRLRKRADFQALEKSDDFRQMMESRQAGRSETTSE